MYFRSLLFWPTEIYVILVNRKTAKLVGSGSDESHCSCSICQARHDGEVLDTGEKEAHNPVSEPACTLRNIVHCICSILWTLQEDGICWRDGKSGYRTNQRAHEICKKPVETLQRTYCDGCKMFCEHIDIK